MARLLALIATSCALGTVSAALADEKFTYVDLQPQANQMLTANLGSGREGNNLAGLPKGEQIFGGVKFKVEDGFIQLGSALLKEPKPDKVEGIKVGKTFAKLHVLHATFYGNGTVIGQEGMEGDPLFVPDGTRIGEYKVHYEDGSAEAVPIVYGQDVRDWWYTENSKGVSRGKVAWEGDNEWAKSLGSRIRLYLGTWENPKPKKKVVSIDYVKGNDTPAAPFWVAMTLEDSSPSLVELPSSRASETKANELSERAQVIKFLKEHVIGKTLATAPVTFKIDDGKIEVTGEDHTSFSNFAETPEGYLFDVISVSKVTSFDLDTSGKRVSPGRDWSGVTVYRYEIAERRSTKRLIGLARVISTTIKDVDITGNFAAVQMTIQDGQLVFKESGVLYSDFLAAGGKFKPGTWEGTSRYSLDGGKLQCQADSVGFDIDPETLKRTPSKDKMPTFISKEIERK